MRLLMVIQSPKLELMVLRCQMLRASPESIDVHLLPEVRINFTPITKLYIEMPANCTPYVLKWIDVSAVEELRLFVTNRIALDSVRDYNGLPTRFGKLRRLRILWKASQGAAVNPIDWFSKDIDLSATIEDANVAFSGAVQLTERVTLPNLLKYTCVSGDEFGYICVPKLRHLYLPYAELGRRDWFHHLNPKAIPIDELDTLQLNIGGNVEDFFGLDEHAFPQFKNLRTLIITHHGTSEGEHFGQSYHKMIKWPIAWRDAGLVSSAESFITPFPRLETLKVALPRSMANSR